MRTFMALSLPLFLGYTEWLRLLYFKLFFFLDICLISAHNRLCLKTRNIRNLIMKYKIIRSKKWEDYNLT